MGSNVCNNGGVGASTLCSPRSVHSAGGRLFVVDADNQRLLIWNTPPTRDQQPADVVLGQPNMTAVERLRPISPKSLAGPRAAYVHGDRLYVSDATDNRVLYWNQIPTRNGQEADGVIGQPSLHTGAPNNGGLSAGRLHDPVGLTADADYLYIVDSLNHRVLGLPHP